MNSAGRLLEYVRDPVTLIAFAILVLALTLIAVSRSRRNANTRVIAGGVVVMGLLTVIGGLWIQSTVNRGQASIASEAATAIAAAGSVVIDGVAQIELESQVAAQSSSQSEAAHAANQTATASGNALAISALRDVYVNRSEQSSKRLCTDENARSGHGSYTNSSTVCLRPPQSRLKDRRVEVRSATSLVGNVRASEQGALAKASIPASFRTENHIIKRSKQIDSGGWGTEQRHIKSLRTSDIPMLGPPKTTHGPLEGHSIMCTPRHGVWEKHALDLPNPTEEQRRELATLCPNDVELYPEHEVHVGSEWELSPSQISALVGLENVLQLKGAATARLTRVSKQGRHTVAEISINRFEVDAQLIGTDGKQTSVRIGGHGSVIRSLDELVDVRSYFKGVWSSTVDAGSFEGQLVTEESQRLVGP